MTVERVDLFWTTPGVTIQGELVSAGAVWHLPADRQGYVDVYQPHRLEGVQRPWLALPVGERRLGRWIEDETTQPAFDLARKGAAQTTTKATQRPAREMVYSKKTQQVAFTPQGQGLLDRATVLITRSVLEGGVKEAAASMAGQDKPFKAPPSQEQSEAIAKTGAREIKPSVWARIPTVAKVAGAAAAGAAAAWLLG